MYPLILIVATVLVLSPATSAQGGSCQACNCQFENLDLLRSLIRAEVRSTYVPWTPVVKTQFGSSDINSATTLSYTIPNIIPNSAKAVLVYPTTRCGYSNADIGADLSYYVVVNGTRYEHFLHMHAYRQNAYNTNSDNMWFPMPSNRLLYIGVPITFPNNCHTFVSVIGYR